MQCNRWALGVVVGLLGTFAQGQVPETVPPVKLPPAASGKEIPGASELIERQEPFIARYAYCNAMQMYQSRPAASVRAGGHAGRVTPEVTRSCTPVMRHSSSGTTGMRR